MKKTVYFISLVIISLTTQLQSSEFKLEDLSLKTGLQDLHGENTYQIGGKVQTPEGSYTTHFPLSELKFPIWTGGQTISVLGHYNRRYSFEFTYSHCHNNIGGQLQDSDYLSRPDQLDIFSKSIVKLDLNSYDLKWSMVLHETPTSQSAFTRFSASVGYAYYKYQYEAYNLYQIYPSDPSSHSLIIDGTVLTYDSTQKFPYGQLHLEKVMDRNTLKISLGYSPFVQIIDQDDHVLRSKLSTGTLTGEMKQAKISYRYAVTRAWSGFIDFHYQVITAKGIQTQIQYKTTTEGESGPIGNIDEKIYTEINDVSFGVIYKLYTRK